MELRLVFRCAIMLYFAPSGSWRRMASTIRWCSMPLWERCSSFVTVITTPIAEAMVALVLMDQALRHRAQCGDVGTITPRIPGQIDG